MTIRQLYQEMGKYLKDQALRLDKDSNVPAEILRLLDDLPEPRLVVHPADLALDERAQPPALSISGSTVGTWPIFGVSATSLKVASIDLTITEAADGALKIEAQLSGTIGIGESELPVQGRLTQEDTWALSLATGSPAQVSFVELASNIGAAEALASLNSRCSGLLLAGPAPVQDFALELGVGLQPQAFLSCRLNLSGQLQILQGLPAFELHSAGMSVIHYPSETTQPQSAFAFGLNATARIGEGSYGVEIGNLGGAGEAFARILSENNRGLPGLHDLAALMGAGKMSTTLQQTIERLGLDGFTITAVEISFNSTSGMPSFVAVSGNVQMAGVAVDVFFRIPEFRLVGQLAHGQLDVAGLIKHFGPGVLSLPSLGISDFAFSVDLDADQLALHAQLAEAWTIDIGNTSLVIERLALNLDHTLAGQQSTTTAKITGTTRIKDLDVDISGQLADVLTFSGRIPRIKLTAIVDRFLKGISLPAELPDFEFSAVKLSFTPATGAFSLTGNSTGQWDFPIDGGGLTISQVSLSVNRETAEGGIACSLKITGTGHGPTAEGLSLDDFSLTFEAGKTQWSVSGDLAVQLFAYQMKLAADFTGNGAGRTLTFSWSSTPAVTLLSLQDKGSLSLSSFGVSLRPGTGEAASGVGVSGAGRIEIGRSLFASDFDVALSAEEGSKKLLFISRRPSPLKVPLGAPVARRKPFLELNFSQIQIEADSAQKSWSLRTNAHGSLHDIPELVQDYFPKDLPNGRFCVDDQGVSFDCTLAEPIAPQCRMFSVKVNGREILPKISIARIGAQLGADPAVYCELHVELPNALNYLLGADSKTQKPRFSFLNPSFELNLSLGKTLSLALANGTSPFKALSYRTDDKGNYLQWNFGTFGVFRLDIPTLSFEGNSWVGTAGVELPSPLRVPLMPIKSMLALLGFPPEVLRYIPDSVPVQAIDFTDLDGSLTNLLGRDAVASLKKDTLRAKALENFEKISRGIAHIVERLPEDFEAYLKIPDIKELRLKLGVSPGGGPIIGLHTDARHPVKIMFPWFASVPPGMMGITLHSLDVGQTTGGLMLIRINGVLDQFDLVGLFLAASQIIPQEQARKLKNEVTFGDSTLIVWPGFPVPIPLTYDQLTWDYQAWTGFKLFADWHLRAQSDLFAIIANLIPFFTNRDVKLHDPPDKTDFKLDLTIGPNYLALPEYLGGAELGPQDALPKMDLAYAVKCFLDAMKFGNAGYLIEAVPLRHPQTKAWTRIGFRKAGVSFGPLKFEAGVGWCITTEAEFKQEIVPDQDAQRILGQLDAAAILDNLPDRSGPAYEKGFIVLLMGHGGLAGVLNYRADFGIAVTSAGGFETKLKMQARIADLLVLNLYGLIKVSEQGRTTLEGGCSMNFRDLEIIGSTQQITFTDTSFELAAQLRLAGACTLSGDFYIGRDQVYLKGEFSWKYTQGNAPERAAGISARFHNTGLEIGVGTANLFGAKCAELSIYVDVTRPDPIGARARLDDLSQLNQKLGLSLQNYKAEIDQAVDGAKHLVDQTMADLNEEIGGFEDLRKRLPGYLNGLRTKTIPDMITARVEGVYATLEWWQKLAVSEEAIRKKVESYYNKNFAGLILTLEERLKAVKGADEAAKNAQTRELLQQALTTIIDIKDISYTYQQKVPFRGTIRKSVTIPDPIKPYREDLQNLRTRLSKLPDRWGKNASAQAAYEAKNRIKQGIDGVVANITRQIPQIDSVRLDLPIAFKTPVVDAYVTIEYADKSYSLKPVHLDLGNPVKSIDSITEAFARRLSGNDG